MKTFDCIVCPMSCRITAHEEIENIRVTGNRCLRGEVFVKQEMTCPMRMLTTTIRIHHALHPLLPVMTSQTIPKEKISDIMMLCNRLEVTAPISAGDIIVHNVLNTGADIIASRSYQKHDQSEHIASYQ